MDKDDLISIVAPMWKQYLKTLLLCICVFILFKLNSTFLIFVFSLLVCAILASMIEASSWQYKIRKDEYDLGYARIDSFIFGMAVINDNGDIAIPFIKNIKQGDEVMVLLVGNDYLIVKKI